MAARTVSWGILPIVAALAFGACTPQPPDADAPAAASPESADGVSAMAAAAGSPAAAVADGDPCSLEIDVTPMPPDEMQALKDRIRREKFDHVLPVVMRAHDIDMWIYVVRESMPDDLGSEDFGDSNAVFIFTDRGGDRIERAALGRRFKGDFFVADQGADFDPVAASGAYDIVQEPIDRAEQPGGEETEYDYRFNGIGEFVAERDPERIALNFMEELGPHVGGHSRDGLSHTDYMLLADELGERYASRLVSHEYLLHDYVSRTTPAELEMITEIRRYLRAVQERDWCRIVPGVTRFSELHSGLWVVTKGGDRIGFREELYPGGYSSADDYVIQKGDLIFLRFGYFLTEQALKDVYGNYYDGLDEIGYVLDDGETEPPQLIRDAWATSLKVHNISERNIRAGRTGREIHQDMVDDMEQSDIMVIDSQVFDENYPDTVQVNLDFHAAGQGDSTLYPAPRLGIYGPDWHHQMPFPVGHHFYIEYFVFVPIPQWDEGSLLIQSHDGAILTAQGVDYLTPRPLDIRIIQ